MGVFVSISFHEFFFGLITSNQQKHQRHRFAREYDHSKVNGEVRQKISPKQIETTQIGGDTNGK